MRTAFVTGANGFLGLNLVEALLAQQWKVLALHRAGSDIAYLRKLAAERVVGDINDRDSLMRVLPKGADAVFHVAGDLNLWSRMNAAQDRVNIEGTRQVAGAALAAGAKRFVHTSTISVYGLQPGRIDETAEKQGRDSWINYQRSKFLAEEEVRKAIARGLDAVIVNPASILGRYDRTGWARIIRLVHERRLPGVPPGKASFCHAAEVARAHVAAAERGRRGENYLLGGTDASFHELVRVIGEVTGRPVPSRPTPAWLLRAAARIRTLVAAVTGRHPALTPETVGLVTREMQCDSGKAMRELGYRAVPLSAMVRESYDWLRQEGFIA